MKNLIRVAAAAALIGVVYPALAQSGASSAAAVRKAAEEFSQGKQAYQDGEYVEAADHFEAADETAPSSNALRAAMMSRKKGGQLDRAATLAVQALARHPDDEKLTGEAQEILAAAEQELYRVEVTCDAECSLAVDSSQVHGPAALEQVVYLTPGSHEIRASWRGDQGTRSETVEAEAGGTAQVEFEQPGVGFGGDASPDTNDDFEEYVENDFANDSVDEDVTKDEAPKGKEGLPPAVFAVGAVATVGLGGATIWSGIDTINKPGTDAVQQECSSTDCSLYQEGQRKELRTNVLIGATSVVGVATIIIGAVATDWGGKGKSKKSRSARLGHRTVEPWVTVGQGAAVGARGRF